MVILAAVGAGAWGSNWIRTLTRMPEVQLRWVCDVSSDSLEKLHRQYPQIRTTTQVEDVLKDQDVAGVVIATVASTHFAIAEKAILAGKHVLVEKPLALTSADAVALNHVARDRGRVLMVGHLLEYHPAVTYIRDMIASGELGEINHTYSQRLNLGTIRTDENVWWSLAPHDIAVACRLFGRSPISVQCRGQSILNVRNNVDVAFAHLEFDGGKLAHIHVSWLDAHKTRRLCVVGSNKMVDFDDSSSDGKIAVFDRGVQLVTSADGSVTKVNIRLGATALPRIDLSEPLLLEAKHFVQCVQDVSRPISDGDSGALVVQVLECGQRSMEQGGMAVAIPNRSARASLAA